MQVLVVGGSNSLLKEGYISHFAKKMTEDGYPVEITNRSAGGTTSLTSLSLIDSIQFRPDLIIFEYCLNDTGHLNHLPDGYGKKRALLEIFFGFLAERLPGVPVMPLLLASQPFYDLNVTNHVYRAEIDFYRQSGMLYHDMRAEMFELFSGVLPDFIYSDLAHFHRGFASSLIGRTLARSAQMLLQTTPHLPIVESAPRIFQASEISKLAGVSIGHAANSHMSTDYVEIRHGELVELQLPAWPVGFAVVSDSDHGNVSIDVDGEAFEVATIHQDCREGRFIFTSVPLMLNDHFMARRRPGPVQVKLSMASGPAAWEFDCLHSNTAATSDSRVRISALVTEA